MTTEIIPPSTPDHFEAIRRLSWDYRDFLLSMGGANSDLIRVIYTPEKYTKVLAELEVANVAPLGAARLALLDGRPVGCGVSTTIAPGTLEFKRIYVAPDARGLGLGRGITQALIDQARADGVERILMDTGKVLETAWRMYLDIGFIERGPYQDLPPEADGLMVFFEMAL